MGDKIVITDIEVVQNGLFQIDIKNENTNKYERIFVKSDELFGMIGQAMSKNHNEYMQKLFEE